MHTSYLRVMAGIIGATVLLTMATPAGATPPDHRDLVSRAAALPLHKVKDVVGNSIRMRPEVALLTPSTHPHFFTQLDGADFQAMSVIEDRDKPHTIVYKMAMPFDYELVEGEQGEVWIIDGKDQVIGVISAPWAKDRFGNQVGTHYNVDGSMLYQHVNTIDRAHYPVVADPRISLGWKWYAGTILYAKFYRSETVWFYRLMNQGGLNALVTGLCASLKHWIPAVVCGAYVSRRYSEVHSDIRYAYRSGRCYWTAMPLTNPLAHLYYFRSETRVCG